MILEILVAVLVALFIFEWYRPTLGKPRAGGMAAIILVVLVLLVAKHIL